MNEVPTPDRAMAARYPELPLDAAPHHDHPAPRILVLGQARLHQMLEPLHARIDAVQDEAMAVALLRHARYDLLVLEFPLGASDHVAVCALLRASDVRIPLLVLNTAGTTDDLLACLAAGADIYLSEPIAATELRVRCAALLRRYGVAVRSGAVRDPATAAQPGSPLAVVALAPRSSSGRLGLIGATRMRVTRVVTAAVLVLGGVAGARILDGASSSSATVAAATPRTVSTSASLTTSASVDVATERAFTTASPSVVYIASVGIGSGSGVIYDSTGDIVTNAHVVAGAQSLRVTLSTGKSYTARLVGTDTADDLAVIHIAASGLPAAPFAAPNIYKTAQTVLAIGSPLGLQESVTSGLISALARTVPESTGAYLPNAIQTSAPINPGNSGGALVTLAGTVVGIPTLQASDPQNNGGGAAQGIGFAVPSERVTYVVKQLIATGTVAHTGRAYLGVSATDAAAQAQSPVVANSGGSPATTVEGALVQQVGSGSPAATAGVQQGDVITAVDGHPIAGESDLLSALAAARPGATMTITLNRSGATITLRAHLGEMPAS